MADRPPSWSATAPVALGFAAVCLLIGSIGAWSIGSQISGAVVAAGVVEVESERQVIQHPDGGVVGEILARDGDTVKAGDVLVRLDGTFLTSELTIVESQLLEIFARMARLKAERDGSVAPDFADAPVYASIGQNEVSEQIEGQRRLFDARRNTLEQRTRQLGEQQMQIDRRIDGIEAQLTGLETQLALIGEELIDVRELFENKLVQASRLLSLQREEARLKGEIGNLVASVAEARTRRAALEIERLSLLDSRREDAITRMRDLRFNEIELQERRIGLLEQLSRLEIRSPASGVVFGSTVAAIRSVVRPADPMMYVIPGDQPMQVSARIDPVHIDQVFPGQKASLMFTTFNLRTTPRIDGEVVRLSADAETDDATGVTFYEAVIRPDNAAIDALADVTLLPGMPVEAFLKTADRTPLNYLTQPLTVYFSRAFRED